MSIIRHDLLTVLLNGLKLSCPKCGKGKVFEKWNLVFEKCLVCHLVLRARESETWFFMYVTTAALTGVFILVMVLIEPKNQEMARYLIGIGALISIVLTVPLRKSLAIAVDFFIDSRLENPKHGC